MFSVARRYVSAFFVSLALQGSAYGTADKTADKIETFFEEKVKNAVITAHVRISEDTEKLLGEQTWAKTLKGRAPKLKDSDFRELMKELYPKHAEDVDAIDLKNTLVMPAARSYFSSYGAFVTVQHQIQSELDVLDIETKRKIGAGDFLTLLVYDHIQRLIDLGDFLENQTNALKDNLVSILESPNSGFFELKKEFYDGYKEIKSLKYMPKALCDYMMDTCSRAILTESYAEGMFNTLTIQKYANFRLKNLVEQGKTDEALSKRVGEVQGIFLKSVRHASNELGRLKVEEDEAFASVKGFLAYETVFENHEKEGEGLTEEQARHLALLKAVKENNERLQNVRKEYSLHPENEEPSDLAKMFDDGDDPFEDDGDDDSDEEELLDPRVVFLDWFTGENTQKLLDARVSYFKTMNLAKAFGALEKGVREKMKGEDGKPLDVPAEGIEMDYPKLNVDEHYKKKLEAFLAARLAAKKEQEQLEKDLREVADLGGALEDEDDSVEEGLGLNFEDEEDEEDEEDDGIYLQLGQKKGAPEEFVTPDGTPVHVLLKRSLKRTRAFLAPSPLGTPESPVSRVMSPAKRVGLKASRKELFVLGDVLLGRVGKEIEELNRQQSRVKDDVFETLEKEVDEACKEFEKAFRAKRDRAIKDFEPLKERFKKNLRVEGKKALDVGDREGGRIVKQVKKNVPKELDKALGVVEHEGDRIVKQAKKNVPKELDKALDVTDREGDRIVKQVEQKVPEVAKRVKKNLNNEASKAVASVGNLFGGGDGLKKLKFW